MKPQATFIDFVLKEWLLVASGAGLLLTSLYTRQIPVYSSNELQVLFILFVLFVTVSGLRNSGLLLRIAQGMEKGKFIPLKLVVATFFLSMLVTNDIALIIVVPLTLSLRINRKGILVILEALAANAGSALTPIGNPQNLYIYWFYHVSPGIFIKTIIPFSLTFLVALILLSALLRVVSGTRDEPAQIVRKTAYIFCALLFGVLMAVLHIIPVWSGILVVICALVVDRKSLRIDYALLLSFFFFFGIADNLKSMLAGGLSHSEHVFLLSAMASQIMSNVPATLLFAKFTADWQALLWGANVGGFGSLFGSLANLIAYKLYVTHAETNDAAVFAVKFLVIGYAALFAAIGLYFMLY